ncbi:MAG: hypothetical protein AAF519_00840 [Bacteroidota bacterium]
MVGATASPAYGTDVEEIEIDIGGEYLITENIKGGRRHISLLIVLKE